MITETHLHGSNLGFEISELHDINGAYVADPATALMTVNFFLKKNITDADSLAVVTKLNTDTTQVGDKRRWQLTQSDFGNIVRGKKYYAITEVSQGAQIVETERLVMIFE